MSIALSKALIITIDGPAGSGKSTTARRAAERLAYRYLDSGALYRAVTWAALQKHIDLDDQEQVARLARSLAIEMQTDNDGLRVLLNDQDITQEIRLPTVTEAIAPVAANPGVREALLETQRRFGRSGGVVAEGRDMGTVVFPEADLKFFMIASLEERAKRRQAELAVKGISVSVSDLIEQIEGRDQKDRHRVHSPLCKPNGAIEIDTSRLTIEEQVAMVVEAAKKKMNG